MIDAVWKIVLIFFIGTGSTFASDVVYLQPSSQIGTEGEEIDYVCNYRLTGQVAQGDSEKLKAIHNSQDDFATLCLNSEGGSFTEGLELAEFIRTSRIKTYLEPDSKCYSACALAFMSGAHTVYEVGVFPERNMHHTANLRFHRPSILKSDVKLNEEQTDQLYAATLASVANMLSKFSTERAGDGSLWFPAPLLQKVMETENTSYFQIDTVDKAGLFRIGVNFDFEPKPALTDLALQRACLNLVKWGRNQSANEKYLHNEFLKTGIVENPDSEKFFKYKAEFMLEPATWECGADIASFVFSKTGLGQKFLTDGAVVLDDQNSGVVPIFKTFHSLPPTLLLNAITEQSFGAHRCFLKNDKTDQFETRCQISSSLAETNGSLYLDQIFLFEAISGQIVVRTAHGSNWGAGYWERNSFIATFEEGMSFFPAVQSATDRRFCYSAGNGVFSLCVE